MTEVEQYQAKLKELYLIEEAQLTLQKLYKQGHFSFGAGGSSTTENLYVESDYVSDYFE
jgi:hypothetical protein